MFANTDFLRSDRPLVIGHRGERKIGPENTLEAFDRAAHQGADGVELDVRLSRDGDVVVLHDEDLARVTDGRDGRRADMLSTAELRAVNLSGGARVPLLGEVLELARERAIFVNVELKRDVPDRVASVVAVAREVCRHPGVRLVLSSFDPIMIAALGALLPAVATALVVHRSSYHDVMLRVRPLTLTTGLHVEHVLLDVDRPLVPSARFRCAWTVNSTRDARRLRALGVDGIITDDPAHVRAAFDDR